MANLTLYIDLYPGGMTVCTGDSLRQHTPWQTVVIDEADLTAPDKGISSFVQALGVCASTLDLSRCRDAVILLDATQICFRQVTLPFSNKKKIRQVLPFELAPHLPGDNQDMVIDFIPLDLDHVADGQTLLCAAVPALLIQDLALGLQRYKIRIMRET